MDVWKVDRRRMLVGLAAVPLGMTASKATAQTLPALQHGMVACRFGQVHYRIARPAKPSRHPPLLCLHASPGSGIGFANFLTLMGEDRTALAMDNPGFGLSDRPISPSTISDFAGAAGDLIDALGFRQIDILGSHTGSATAIELARQRPKAVRRIVVHSALMFTQQEIADYERRLEGSVPDTLDAAAARLPDLWKRFGKFRTDLGDIAAWQLFWEMNRDPLHMGWGHDAAFAYDFPAALRQVRQPILILNPKEGLSPITARARGFSPNISMIDLPYGDGLFSAHASDVAPLIRRFLG